MEQIALEGVNGSIAASMEIDRGVDAFYLSTHMKAAVDPREAPALGRMTIGQFSGLTERLRNAMASLNSMAVARFTSSDTVETNIEQLSEDCGLSADAVRHMVRIASQEL